MSGEYRSAKGAEGDTVGEVFTVCTTSEGVILSGYDATSYFDGAEPVKGDAAIASEYQGATYHFASPENKAKFDEAPETYAPAFGAFCAKAVSEGDVFYSNPKAYLIQNGKLLLFFDNGDINTKAMWEDPQMAWHDGSHESGGTAEERLAAAEQHWAAGPPVVKQAGGGRQPDE